MCEQNLALYTYLRFAVSTGARRSQLLALRWANLDQDRSAVAFTRALVEGPDGPVLRPTKTHRSYRVDLDRDTLDVVAAHRANAETNAAAAGVELIGTAFVFSSDADGARPWRPNWVTKRFIDARRAAGLPHFRLHDLRHFRGANTGAQSRAARTTTTKPRAKPAARTATSQRRP